MSPQLAAISRVLHTAEGKPRIRLDDPVDGHVTNVQSTRQPRGALGCRAPDTRTQPVFGLVGKLHRLIRGGDPRDGRNRSKGLFIERRHAGFDSHKQGWRIEVAGALEALASGQEYRP